MKDVIVIGSGAAGMMTAIWAARRGLSVAVMEKNEKSGKKLYITGKGRCNLTNACDMDTLFSNVVTNRKFLYRAFYGFTNEDTIGFFQEIGLKTKVERGSRVFPASDKASDVISALTGELKKLGVDIHYHTIVKKICIEDKQVKGVEVENASSGTRQLVQAHNVVVATGGCSYESTGSSGDGYRFARELGHQVTETSPSLVPLNVKEGFVKELQGLALKNISISLKAENKQIYQDFGEMLFTHFGVSGPVILSASSYLSQYQRKKSSAGKKILLTIDLKPALSQEALDGRILRDFEEYKNRQFGNALDKLLPKKMIPVLVKLTGIDPLKKVNGVTKEERRALIRVIKEMTMEITGLRGFQEAVVTRGGVSVKEINPATMESLLVSGVYFVGEVLDLDALTGGFNLQIAWSTAYGAGSHISVKEERKDRMLS